MTKLNARTTENDELATHAEIRAKVLSDRRWRTVDQWENAPIIAHDSSVTQMTRGAWIDGSLAKLLVICEQHGFEITDTQLLRDDLFDFVRAHSRQ